MMDPPTTAERHNGQENVFCNPVFESEEEREEAKGHLETDVYLEPKAGERARREAVCTSRFLMLLTFIVLGVSLCVTLILLLKREWRPAEVLTGAGDASPLDSWFGDSEPQNVSFSLTPPSLEPVATPSSGCGGVLTAPAGTLSSPNHPAPYPPDSLCVWTISVSPPHLVQLHVSVLAIEGPWPCLFDWLEVREDTPSSGSVTRFCGSVAPPTLNTNSSSVLVSFRSDSSITATGFNAQYQSVLPGQRSCSREEFLCDGGRCLLPVSLCDGHQHCLDQSDEANCSQKQKTCGGKMTGTFGSFFSPNHPNPYPHQQMCTWQISVEDGHVIRLSFQNFSLESQVVCEFDYVEVVDSTSDAGNTVLGRFCGSELPPEVTSSGSLMTVVFVADEGVADSGFLAWFKAVPLSERTCGPRQFSCSSGECLHPDWVCDGWSDCADAADEQNCSSSLLSSEPSSCEPIQVEMCLGLSYNLTSFPNVWLSISDQREAASLLLRFRVRTTGQLTGVAPPSLSLSPQVLQELPCFQAFRRLLCGLFLPLCSSHSGVLQPCRSVCITAEQQCSQTLNLLSLSWSFNCLLLPEPQTPEDCSLP